MSENENPVGRTLAVALHYDHENAPRVVAKGKGLLAERIIALAQENGVPVEDNPVLVQALAGLDLGEEIPEEMYQAVAEIISFVLSLAR